MTWFWTGFILLVLCLLALDLGVLNRKAHRPSLKEALGWTAGWVTLGVLFSGVVYYMYEHRAFGMAGELKYTGTEAMLTYLTGFVLEESLSIDNLFVMVLIFRAYRVPGQFQHRVLFWGILGAIVMRAGMILTGTWLLQRFAWITYVFGAYLIVQGLLQLKPEGDDEEDDGPPRHTLLEKMVGKLLPVHREDAPSGHFLVRTHGRLHATTLFIALLSVEGADVVFALDSVPAVLTVSTDPFIVFTSNVFAILGLRSIYFVIADMMDRFGHLKYALAFILTFVGFKMVAHDYVHIPIGISLGLILGAVVIGVFSSMLASRESAETPN